MNGYYGFEPTSNGLPVQVENGLALCQNHHSLIWRAERKRAHPDGQAQAANVYVNGAVLGVAAELQAAKVT